MNHELISQICFAEIYVVPSHQTARSLFTRLPHGMAYADTLVECLATGYLIAVVESSGHAAAALGSARRGDS